MVCSRTEFYKELLNSSEEILAKGDENSQWELFEKSLNKYINDLKKKSLTTPCSLYTSHILVTRLNIIRDHDVNLSSLLLDLMTILVSNSCAMRYVNLLCYFEETPFSRKHKFHRVILALRHHSGFMKLMLNFGFISSLRSDTSGFMKELKLEFSRFMLKMTPTISAAEYSEIEDQSMELVESAFFRHNKSECWHKRMFLALIAIRAIEESLRNDENRSKERVESYVTSLRMYFAGVRDTYLSVFEVRSILYICFKLLSKLHLFDIYCRKFDKLMSECPAKMEPRFLTDLVRYQIRQNLNVSGLLLPSTIEQLYLPKRLKSFLLGDTLSIKQKIGGNGPSRKCVTQMELELLMSKLSIH